MTNSHRPRVAAGSAPAYSTAPVLAVVLAAYAIAVPLAVSGMLASYLPPALPSFGPTLALGAVMIGPCLVALATALRGAAPIARELAQFRDDEPQQVVAHLLGHGLIFAYVAALATARLPAPELPGLFAVSLLGVLCGWLLFVHLLVQTEPSRARRLAAMVTDVAFTSIYLHIGGALAAPLFPIYVMLAVGFGYSGGARGLIGGTLLSLIGFGAVIATTPFWSERPSLAAGVLVAILALPCCTARLLRRLRRARDEAEAANAANVRLLAAMSHELRTPLNSMIGTASLLARTGLDPDQLELLGGLQQGARNVLGLINDILDLAKIEMGKLRPEVEGFVLHDLLGGAIAALRPQAQTKGVALALRIDSRLPTAYRGFPLQLRQLLVNLLGSLIKAKTAGRIDIAASFLGRDASAVRLRLSLRDDNGETLGFHSQLARQASTSDGAYGAAGIGIDIVRQLVQLLGGALTSEQEAGRGILFALELPLELDPGGASRTPDLAGREIVLVTADADLAATLRDKIGAWRGGTLWLAEGEAALRQVSETAPEAPRPTLLIDGCDDPLAALSLAHRLATLPARQPAMIFIAAPGGGEVVAGLGAQHLAAILEMPLEDGPLAGALLAATAGEMRSALPALPAAAPRELEAAAPVAEPLSIPAPARRLKLLIAEDNSANRKILRRILETAGHETTVVDNGETALGVLDRERFDLVLIDVIMPQMSGYEVAKLYRMEHLGEGRLPIVALATDTTAETERQCREAGIDAVLTKPIEAAQLLAAIDETYARVVSPGGGALASPVVTPISAHPRYFADAGAVVDEATIEALRMLGGGSDFLGDVIETFCSDGRRLLEHLRQAVAEGDLRGFKELTHSLRSGAANVGAARLCLALSGLRDISAKDLRQYGGSYLEKLQAEFAKLETTLSGMIRESRHG